MEFNKDLKVYSDKANRKAQIEELQALMKIELGKIQEGEDVDPNEEYFEDAQKGYPSFMRGVTADELDKLKSGNNLSYTVMHGPAEWREELHTILENLIDHRETKADLEKIDNWLMTLYVKKNDRNDDDPGNDHQMRHCKEIRRRQYGNYAKERSQSKGLEMKSPERQKKIVQPPSEYKANDNDMLNRAGQFLANNYQRLTSPQSMKKQETEIILTDLDEHLVKASDWDDPRNKVDYSQPAQGGNMFGAPNGKVTVRGQEISAVKVPRLPNSKNSDESEIFEELLNENWERRLRGVKGKIKNFVTEDGQTRDTVEDCVHGNGEKYLKPIPGNLKRKNHPNSKPSVFQLNEELQNEDGLVVRRSIDGWLKYDDNWESAVEYTIDETGQTKCREIKGTFVIDYDNYPKGDGLTPKTNHYVVEERNDQNGNLLRRRINGTMKVTTVNGKTKLAEVFRTDEGLVRREVKGVIHVIDGAKNWFEEIWYPEEKKIERRTIRGNIRREVDNEGNDRLVEEHIDVNGRKIKRTLGGDLKEDSGLEILNAEVLWNMNGRKELVLQCLKNGDRDTVKIDIAGAVLDGGGKELTEEYFDNDGNKRVRRIFGDIKLVGSTNADLRMVEQTKDSEGNVNWRVIEGVLRPIDQNNVYLMDLLAAEKERASKRLAEGVRQVYTHPDGMVVERKVTGRLVRGKNKDGDLVWYQQVGDEMRQILGDIIGLKEDGENLDLGLIEEYVEDGALVRRAIRGDLHVKQNEDGRTELHEVRNGSLYEIIRGTVKNLGGEEGSKMVLVDEWMNKKNCQVRREISGKLEEVVDAETKNNKIVERAHDLDGNEIINDIKGSIKLVKVMDYVRNDSKTGDTIYDFIEGRRDQQAFLGRVIPLNLNEGRGLELVEESTTVDGASLVRVLPEIDLSLACWHKNSAIEDAMSPTKVKIDRSGNKFITHSGSHGKRLFTDGEKKDGFFEEITDDKGDKTLIRMRGVLKIGVLQGKRVLVEEGLDKDGNFIVRAVNGVIINPRCTYSAPSLLEVYQAPNGEELTRFLAGEIKIFEERNGRFLMEQLQDRDDDIQVMKRRVVEGYVHSNDKVDNKVVIVEKVKDNTGFLNSKRIIGCLRNLYKDNISYVVEEYQSKENMIKTRIVYGYLTFCLTTDQPISLKAHEDDITNKAAKTNKRQPKDQLKKTVNTLQTVGRFKKATSQTKIKNPVEVLKTKEFKGNLIEGKKAKPEDENFKKGEIKKTKKEKCPNADPETDHINLKVKLNMKSPISDCKDDENLEVEILSPGKPSRGVKVETHVVPKLKPKSPQREEEGPIVTTTTTYRIEGPQGQLLSQDPKFKNAVNSYVTSNIHRSPKKTESPRREGNQIPTKQSPSRENRPEFLDETETRQLKPIQPTKPVNKTEESPTIKKPSEPSNYTKPPQKRLEPTNARTHRPEPVEVRVQNDPSKKPAVIRRDDSFSPTKATHAVKDGQQVPVNVSAKIKYINDSPYQVIQPEDESPSNVIVKKPRQEDHSPTKILIKISGDESPKKIQSPTIRHHRPSDSPTNVILKVGKPDPVLTYKAEEVFQNESPTNRKKIAKGLYGFIGNKKIDDKEVPDMIETRVTINPSSPDIIKKKTEPQFEEHVIIKTTEHRIPGRAPVLIEDVKVVAVPIEKKVDHIDQYLGVDGLGRCDKFEALNTNDDKIENLVVAPIKKKTTPRASVVAKAIDDIYVVQSEVIHGNDIIPDPVFRSRPNLPEISGKTPPVADQNQTKPVVHITVKKPVAPQEVKKLPPSPREMESPTRPNPIKIPDRHTNTGKVAIPIKIHAGHSPSKSPEKKPIADKKPVADKKLVADKKPVADKKKIVSVSDRIILSEKKPESPTRTRAKPVAPDSQTRTPQSHVTPKQPAEKVMVKKSPMSANNEIDKLRQLENKMASKIIRRWRQHRRLKFREGLLPKEKVVKAVDGKNWMGVDKDGYIAYIKDKDYLPVSVNSKKLMPIDSWTRDEFEDIYVRFMMFLDTLPKDINYEKLFNVFMFYLDESRDKRKFGQNYSESERIAYIKEHYEMFRANMDQGRDRARMYKSDYIMPDQLTQSQKVEVVHSQRNLSGRSQMAYPEHYGYGDYIDARGYLHNDTRPTISPQYGDYRQPQPVGKPGNTIAHIGPNGFNVTAKVSNQPVHAGLQKPGIAQSHFFRDGKEYIMRDGKEYLVVGNQRNTKSPRMNAGLMNADYSTKQFNHK